jgi:hypothetical protein
LRGRHDVARRFSKRRFPARTDQDFHALVRQRASRFKAYPFAAASDERCLACKPEFHRHRSFQKWLFSKNSWPATDTTIGPHKPKKKMSGEIPRPAESRRFPVASNRPFDLGKG